MDALLSDWIVVGVLASPHLLYAYIWFFSEQWMAAFRKRSVQVFENVAWLLKGEGDRGDRPACRRRRCLPA